MINKVYNRVREKQDFNLADKNSYRIFSNAIS